MAGPASILDGNNELQEWETKWIKPSSVFQRTLEWYFYDKINRSTRHCPRLHMLELLFRIPKRVLVIICFGSQQNLAPSRGWQGYRIRTPERLKCPDGLLVSTECSLVWQGKKEPSSGGEKLQRSGQFRRSGWQSEVKLCDTPCIWVWHWIEWQDISLGAYIKCLMNCKIQMQVKARLMG